MMGVGDIGFTSRKSDFSIAYWEARVCEGVTEGGGRSLS